MTGLLAGSHGHRDPAGVRRRRAVPMIPQCPPEQQTASMGAIRDRLLCRSTQRIVPISGKLCG
jgi:hypothetical protein